jgi:hypothetical protein
MNDSELGKSLLQAGAAEHSGLPAGRHLTATILDRDRRRIRLLGSLTLVLWLLGAGGMAFVLYKLAVYVPQYLAFAAEKEGTTSMPRRQSITETSLAGFQIGLVVVSCSVAVLALAALGTFVLVLTTRRATLRQLNASLTLICERLEQLQELRQREGPVQAARSNSPVRPGRET